jgi:hypothetical protein
MDPAHYQYQVQWTALWTCSLPVSGTVDSLMDLLTTSIRYSGQPYGPAPRKYQVPVLLLIVFFFIKKKSQKYLRLQRSYLQLDSVTF